MNDQLKKTYKKPIVDVIQLSVNRSVLTVTSVTVGSGWQFSNDDRSGYGDANGNGTEEYWN